MLPFTHNQFIFVFAVYNGTVWPAQVVAYLIGAAVVLLLILRPSRATDRFIGASLAAMWAWTGVAYHVVFFSAINKLAWMFGALFVVQAALLFYVSVVQGRLRFASSRGTLPALGWALIAYACIVYPLFGLWAGYRYPGIPTFGITPCPVTIFTFGLLLLTTAPVPRWLVVIPLAWSLIGGSASYLLDVPQDWLLLASGGAAWLILRRDRTRPAAASGLPNARTGGAA